MDVYAVWPAFACMALLLLIINLPLFRCSDPPTGQQKHRISTLDGLRGFLAFGVFFHHGTTYHEFLASGRWDYPPSLFYARLGGVGVSLFFMITGYLFWGKIIKDRGRPDWIGLYIGRVFRIMPVYLTMVAVLLAAVMIGSGFQLNVGIAELVRELVRWLAGGVVEGADVNGYHGTRLLTAGVTWTLRYEWLFYASLILTAFAARATWSRLVFPLGGLLLALAWVIWMHNDADFPPSKIACLSLFFAGMACAGLEAENWLLRWPDWLRSLLVIGLLGLAFNAFASVYSAGTLAALMLVFYLVVSGCSMFGLLTSRAAHRLGHLSYAIYLLQGLVLAAVLTRPAVRSFALASPVQYWLSIALCAILLASVSCGVHVFIERPGVALGRKLVQGWRERRGIAPEHIGGNS